MEYKFNKNAGVLNEAAMPNLVEQGGRRRVAARSSNIAQDSFDETSAVHNLAPLLASAAAIHAQSRGTALTTRGGGLGGAGGSGGGGGTGRDPIAARGGGGMFYQTVQEGDRVRVIESDGRVRVVVGPARFWRGRRRVEPMLHYIAHPGEFLIVRFRDGRQEHLVGPADLWFDPREHASVEKEDALQIASKEAVVVYSKDPKTGEIQRRIVRGPTAFVPAAGEWLHTFSWHGSKGGDDGYQKVPNALVFQKLWFLPDQMYHDVNDVRTADDAVLTIRLMIFFEMVDVENMLDTTHDPIGDFVNAATSDVVEMVSKHDFESFKRHTEKLNETETYRQLLARASQCGYRIHKVVYRGYGAPDSLQRMHDEAIESRTRLQLERATQQQAQDLEDFTLGRAHSRAALGRSEEQARLEHQIEQNRRQQEADLREASVRAAFEREQAQAEAAQRSNIEKMRDDAQRKHLQGLRELGVDLTALLTQGRADRVIELRGGASSPHVHLDPTPERR